MKKFLCLSVLSMLALCVVASAAQEKTSAPPVRGALPSSGAPPADYAAAARAFVETLAREDFAGAVKSFDPQMTQVFPPEKLRELWQTINGQVGALKRIVSTRTEKAAQFDAGIVTCEFERSGIEVKVVFAATGQITGLFFAPVLISSGTYASPAYVRADAFQSKQVTVGAGEWALPGTLTLPMGKGPFPAVVLVHGSGPNDRDETVGANKPFRDLAEGLASQGVAVLRYEKRTKEHAAKLAAVMSSFTVKEETVDDAVAAVALLSKTEGIDARRVFVLGHSLGATVAPRIARAAPGVAGLIIMAGLSRPLEDILVPQFTYVYSLKGKPSPEEQAQLDKLRQQVAKIKDPRTNDSTPASEMPFGLPAHYWLSMRNYRAAEDARTLPQPMLVVQGERDYQVPMEDFEGWKILSARKDVTLKSYPKLNHLFLEGEGKSTPAEYSQAANIPKYVIDDIAAWVRGH